MAFGNSKNLPIWRSKYILWIIMCIPGIGFSFGLINGKLDYNTIMHATGEFSGRFLIFSLIATPLMMLFPKFKFPKWLGRNRRYFGMAAFGYCVFHLGAYVMNVSITDIASEFFEFGILTAWVSFIIWVPMAITSTNGWVRQLKGTWKKIHNWGYLAALLAYLHWAFVGNHWKPALVHAAPIIILQLYRWITVWRNKKAKQAIIS